MSLFVIDMEQALSCRRKLCAGKDIYSWESGDFYGAVGTASLSYSVRGMHLRPLSVVGEGGAGTPDGLPGLLIFL